MWETESETELLFVIMGVQGRGVALDMKVGYF
jgi:hypothetical protein